MLAELAAANAAFSVIKSAVQNGKEIASAGKAIANFVGAKEQLQRKAQKKGGRREAEEARIKKHKHHVEVAIITFVMIVIACVFATVVLLILHHQGKL